ncbi:diaminopropionate ammonia-lyase [Stappia sp. ICDLI1TA098]
MDTASLSPSSSPRPWWCAPGAPEEVARFLGPTMGLAATPLRHRPDLASALGLGALFLKDETARMGLGSFKALGGAYAVIRLVHRAAESTLGRCVEPAEIGRNTEVREIASRLTVTTASAGNHGLSVAAGARLAGAKARILIHLAVGTEVERAIATLGAEVVRINGSYETAVAEAAKAGRRDGVLAVPDIAEEGEPGFEASQFVMQGYSVLAGEIIDALEAAGEAPTHVFVQAGVGGLAAGVMGYWRTRHGATALPRFVVVEPESAACLAASARAGRLSEIAADGETIMTRLDCLKPAAGAWPTVASLASNYLSISDGEARAAMSQLAAGTQAISVGPSGAAGLAGLCRACGDPDLRTALDLGENAKVVVLLTERAT